MVRFDLHQAAIWMDARHHGANHEVVGVSTDTRSLQPGELFVALQGPSFDGHDYLAMALEKGAVGAVVNRRMAVPLAQLQVDDTLRALGRLGGAWRGRFPGTVVALTGSNGKTTVKEMIAAILARCGSVLATVGNLNNEIGVPLTLLRLVAERYAVIEMGANHPREIAYLTALVRPHVGLITNAGPAHLEGFGSLPGVAKAKGEIYQNLPSDGIALINRDDRFAELWQDLAAPRRTIGFGLGSGSQIRGEPLAGEGRLRLRMGDDTVDVHLPLAGEHNLRNAVAAAAAAHTVGAPLSAIAEGLEGMTAVKGRLQFLPGVAGTRLVDDTYNANPASVQAAMASLDGDNRWLILGDMAELGQEAQAMHAAVGKQAREAGFRRLYGVGELSRAAVVSFGEGGRFFSDIDALIGALRAELPGNNNAQVLIKGSRSMRMEQVVDALRHDTGHGER